MPHVSTIAALATTRGSSGIGIIRLSGPDSWAIAEQLIAGQPTLVDRMANVRRIWRPTSGEVLDLSLIHISEPTRLGMISYAVFCLKKKKTKDNIYNTKVSQN